MIKILEGFSDHAIVAGALGRVIPARRMIDSSAAVHIVRPTKVGNHDFANASRKFVDGGPPPAMTCSGRRWVIPFAGWY